jgi:hypothetical protein
VCYRALIVSLNIVVVHCVGTAVYGQAIATLDENSQLGHVLANALPGAVTLTPSSLVFDVVPPSGPGTDPLGVTISVLPMEIDFTPSEHRWLMRLRILEGNNFDQILVHAFDHDANDPALTQEIWEYRFDISTLTPADGWVELKQGFSSPSLMVGMGDGIFNPDLPVIAFVVNDPLKTRLHVELDCLRIVRVPEPSGVSLVLLGMWASAAFRSKRSRNGCCMERVV